MPMLSAAPMPADPHDLARFVAAQQSCYQEALAELAAGAKRGHWMWFVFPQLAGLGSSAMAERYAIRSLDEARAYLAHPVLGPRLHACLAALAALPTPPERPALTAEAVFGPVDAMKLRSSLTLFHEAGGGPTFAASLDRWCAGILDPATLQRLPARPARPALRLLPPTLIDRIAAGEVIERPAAALKELVENALDAGARRIEVAIDGGGIDRIDVTDDGHGMTETELALCVQRHATSKLSDDTLVRIETLGFRGEALPSIGAAARLSLVSRVPGAPHASRITVEGGTVGPVCPAAGAPGTTVTVRDLFYATPARRKFLKSPRSEADAAEAALRRLAFAAPGVAFRLTIDGRVLLDLPPQDRAARVAALLGPDASSGLIPLHHARFDLLLEGAICAPSLTRATTGGQSLVVNHRPVADPVLRLALRVAYRNVIEAGRHPLAALYLTIPPEALDVNVHPAKSELRFRDAEAVRALVIGGVQRALAGPAGGPAPVTRLHRPALSLRPPPMPQQGFAEPRLAYANPPAARTLPDPTAADPEPGLSPPDHQPDHPLGAPLAQLLDTYILAVASEGALVLIDQHAAHERLTHEALRSQLLGGAVRAQTLLLPVVVDLPRAEAAALLAQAQALARLGLEVEPFGPGAVMVRALPAVLLEAARPPDTAALLRDLAEEFAASGEALALDALLDAAIARLACHGSIRAGRRLTRAEMDALLRQMEATPRAATCSHGRPTFLKLSQAEIEKLFGRR